MVLMILEGVIINHITVFRLQPETVFYFKLVPFICNQLVHILLVVWLFNQVLIVFSFQF